MRKVKQLTAGLLTAGMVLTGAPFGNFVARASTVLQPNTALNQSGTLVNKVGNWVFGSSNTTAFVFGDSSGHKMTNGRHEYDDITSGDSISGADSATFNVSAILNDNDRTKTSRGYYSFDVPSFGPSSEPTLKSAYGRNWWHGYYTFRKPWKLRNSDASFNNNTSAVSNSTSPADPIITSWTGEEPSAIDTTWTPNRKALHTGSGHFNGEVQTLTDGTKIVELRQEVKPSRDGGIIVEYTAYNPTTNTVDFMVGNETDTMIGEQDDVPIFVPKDKDGNYKRMFNSTLNNYLEAKCKKLGITVISAHALRHTHASVLSLSS